ncbi:MAG: conjugal transfer protein TraL [Alphaproteobacteria bacterium]|nr:conjugal transfer protein TraL [Alphaproteobacteria bacterium]
MKHLHMILQGKGGVGKSFVASLLAQHFQAKGSKPICIDTDPVNKTFAGYKAFDAARIELMNGDDLDPRAFDELIETVMAAEDCATFVVDNGASSFVPLCSWLIENEVIGFLKDAGVNLVVHSVITGGQAYADTMAGLGNLLKHFDVPLVVWLNEFYGKTEHNGTPFEKTALFKGNTDRIHAVIRLPQRRKETFGHDLDLILRDKKTFAEARLDPGLSIMTRQRLVMIWRDLDQLISNANL